jgi:hypothetical protein
MENKYKIGMICALLLSLSLACNLPPASLKSNAPGKAPADAPRAATAPAGAPSTGGEITYMELYTSGVQSGRWSEEGGILAVLQLLAGTPGPFLQPAPGSLNDWEASAVLREGIRLAGANPGAPETPALTRLVNQFMPDPARVLPYARKEGETSSGGGIIPASFNTGVAGQEEACANIFNDGFPEPAPGAAAPVCVLYRTFTAAGAEFRIFYPRAWAGDTARIHWMDAAEDALRSAAGTLAGYSAAGWQPTDMVFTTVGGSGASSPAMASVPLTPGRCNIGAYPKAMTFSEADFKQILAHEIFHCLQYNNMSAAMALPPGPNLWWQEGSAEYFGNVVYPANNLEYKHLPLLTLGLKTRPLFGLTYKNFYFYQYLGNTIGNNEIIALINSFGTRQSEAEYGQALDAYFSDEGRFFSNFGRQFLDSSVADSGGGNIPVESDYGEAYEMDLTSNVNMDAPPFKLTWFRLVFPENYEFRLNVRQSGSGIIAARQMDMPGSWGDLPAAFNTACGRREYLVLLTNTQPGTAFNFQLNATKKKSDTCEPCLLGDWKLVPESFLPYEQEMLQPNFNVSSAVAELEINFTKEGRSDFNWISSTVLGTTNPAHGARAYNIEFHGSGPQSYHYETDDIQSAHGTITFTEPSGALNYQFIIDGQPVAGSFAAADFDFGFGPGQANYTCSGDDLVLTPIVPGKFPTGWQMKRQPVP